VLNNDFDTHKNNNFTKPETAVLNQKRVYVKRKHNNDEIVMCLPAHSFVVMLDTKAIRSTQKLKISIDITSIKNNIQCISIAAFVVATLTAAMLCTSNRAIRLW
jgi:hypothetical protein